MNANVLCTRSLILLSTLRYAIYTSMLFVEVEVEVEVERHHHQINSDHSVQLSSQLRLCRFWALVPYSFLLHLDLVCFEPKASEAVTNMLDPTVSHVPKFDFRLMLVQRTSHSVSFLLGCRNITPPLKCVHAPYSCLRPRPRPCRLSRPRILPSRDSMSIYLK